MKYYILITNSQLGATITILLKLLLLHLVGCLYYFVSDARSHKHEIKFEI